MANFKRPTTLDLINNGKYANAATSTVIETLGFTTKGDGGGGLWKKTGTTGLTPSQTPSQLVDSKLTDALGHEWELVDRDLSIKMFGAVGDGSTDDLLAFQAMASAKSYVKVADGTFALTTATLDVPLIFEYGGHLTVASGQTLTITQKVESPRQFIFQGDGTYVIGHDSDDGEEARMLHVSWFGVFPKVGDQSTDQAPAINKAINSVQNNRESVVEFDVGNYNILTNVSVTRGCWIKGSGIRRTVFRLGADGFDAFSTNETACKFSDIQFELGNGLTDRTSGACIAINHTNAVVERVNTTTSKKSIVVAGNNSRVRDITCLFSNNSDSESSVIEVAASQITVTGVNMLSSSDGPESVVRVTSGSGISISNVNTISPSIPVYLEAVDGNISRVNVTDVVYNGFSGGDPSAIVRLETSGTNSIDFVNLSNLVGNSKIVDGVKVYQNSTGTTDNIMITGVTVPAQSDGVDLERISGTLDKVYISGCNFADVGGLGVRRTGSVTNTLTDPMSRFAAAPSYIFDAGNVANDDVFSVDMGQDIFSGTLVVTAGHTVYGFYAVRAAGSPGITAIATGGSIAATTGPLTGTTGTPGNLTVSVDDDGLFYVENRLGSSQRIQVNIMTGIV